MGSLITLAIYAAIAGAAWLAIHSFLNGYEEKGAARQLAADKPVIEACKLDRDTAVKANVTLKADVDRIGAERDAQSKAVAEQARLAALQLKARDEALASASARLRQYQNDNVSLASILEAAGKVKGGTCDDILAKVDGNLRALARDRVRFLPPAADGDDGRPKPAAGEDPDRRPMLRVK